ncbi:hypothetical protein [Pseudomonas sp.]|uniref:hypothetical protein n=1 Tax=Pseudomonas sp. TaxID=306 RepID=UPI00299EA763|nr:hypothetical protein [Pseudomonas sp.]MDX1368381.1 hypothetical protein [Pseudomonas sp.]
MLILAFLWLARLWGDALTDAGLPGSAWRALMRWAGEYYAGRAGGVNWLAACPRMTIDCKLQVGAEERSPKKSTSWVLRSSAQPAKKPYFRTGSWSFDPA